MKCLYSLFFVTLNLYGWEVVDLLAFDRELFAYKTNTNAELPILKHHNTIPVAYLNEFGVVESAFIFSGELYPLLHSDDALQKGKDNYYKKCGDTPPGSKSGTKTNGKKTSTGTSRSTSNPSHKPGKISSGGGACGGGEPPRRPSKKMLTHHDVDMMTEAELSELKVEALEALLKLILEMDTNDQPRIDKILNALIKKYTTGNFANRPGYKRLQSILAVLAPSYIKLNRRLYASLKEAYNKDKQMRTK